MTCATPTTRLKSGAEPSRRRVGETVTSRLKQPVNPSGSLIGPGRAILTSPSRQGHGPGTSRDNSLKNDAPPEQISLSAMMPAFSVIDDNTPADMIAKGAVVALGNFDGVHLGHRAVISKAIEMAAQIGRPAWAVTFEPHPRSFFSPNTPLFRLSDQTRKAAPAGRNRHCRRGGHDIRRRARRHIGARFH